MPEEIDPFSYIPSLSNPSIISESETLSPDATRDLEAVEAEFKRLLFSFKTDLGKVRAENQDNVCGRVVKTKIGPRLVVIVADGMGGHVGGAEASLKITTAFPSNFAHRVNNDQSEEDALVDAVMDVASDITQLARGGIDKEDSLKNAPGSTAAILVVDENGSGFFINVGDTRIYETDSKSTNTLFQLTEDDSMVAEMVRRREITNQEAKTHPSRSVITKCFGAGYSLSRNEVRGKLKKVIIGSGQALMIVSDGLWGMAQDPEILRVLQTSTSTDIAVSSLIDLANNHGGEDNISVAIVSFGPLYQRPAPDDSTQNLLKNLGGFKYLQKVGENITLGTNNSQEILARRLEDRDTSGVLKRGELGYLSTHAIRDEEIKLRVGKTQWRLERNGSGVILTPIPTQTSRKLTLTDRTLCYLSPTGELTSNPSSGAVTLLFIQTDQEGFLFIGEMDNPLLSESGASISYPKRGYLNTQVFSK